MLLSRRHLPLNALRAFEAVGHRGHLRKAAEDLGVTHGAVSRQIKLLEETLEVQLFNRDKKQLTLTSAGSRLLEAVSGGFDQITEAALYLDPGNMQGPLYIASTPSLSATWLIGMIGEFSRAYPEVEIHLLPIEPRQQELPAQFDVAICYGEPTIGDHDIAHLYQESYRPVCSPTMISSEAPIQSVADLYQYPLLHDRHRFWERWLREYGTDGQAQCNLHLHESFQALSAARRGFGIAMADSLEIREDLKSGQLIQLFEKAIPALYAVYIVTQTEQRATLRAQVFSEFVQKHIAVL